MKESTYLLGKAIIFFIFSAIMIILTIPTIKDHYRLINSIEYHNFLNGTEMRWEDKIFYNDSIANKYHMWEEY